MPATLSRMEAAAYTGLSPNTFDAEVAAGHYPQPLPHKARRKLWSKAALDRVINPEQPAPVTVDEDINKAIDNYAA